MKPSRWQKNDLYLHFLVSINSGGVFYWFLSFTASEMVIWANNNGCNPHFLIIRLQESVRQKKPTLFKSIRVAQRAANKEMVYFHEHTIDMDMEPSGFPAVLKYGFALESLSVSSGINFPKIQEKSCQKNILYRKIFSVREGKFIFLLRDGTVINHLINEYPL